MILWNSDRDEKLLQSLSRLPNSSRVQRYYYFWVSVRAYTLSRLHVNPYTHEHIQSTALLSRESARRLTDAILFTPLHSLYPFTSTHFALYGQALTYGRKTCIPRKIQFYYFYYRSVILAQFSFPHVS